MTNVGKLVTEAFRLHGLDLRVEAKRYISALMAKGSIDDPKVWLEKVVAIVLKQPMNDSVIDVDFLREAIKLNSSRVESVEDILQVIDAFSIPCYVYNCERKNFLVQGNGGGRGMFSGASDKAALYENRYSLIRQRLLRHHIFLSPNVLGLTGETQKLELKNVEHLLSAPTFEREDVIVLGMLTQLKEDKFYVEDPTGYIQLDLTEAEYKVPGLYTENCMVLIQGFCQDKILHVQGMCHPPPEESAKTKAQFPDVNFFGGKISQKLPLLAQAEQDNHSAIFVILSDVWLDSTKCLQKLDQLFAGYADYPPFAFILCGHFTSKPYGKHQYAELKEGFKKLAQILKPFQNITERSVFIFVPGLQDPVLGDIMPRLGIPDSLTAPIRSVVANCHFGTNPCRIRYCTQEIMVCREDLIHKMCRNTIRMPSSKNDIPRHFAHTILSQGHLTPLPLHVSPVYWPLDHALHIYPLPDLVVVADKFDPYTVVDHGCTVTNPGSFEHSNFAFKVYVPATRTVEDSMIPSD